MDEFISREATIKRIKEVYCVGCNSYHGVRCRACGTGDAIDMIEDAPAADAAPVVHGRWLEPSRLHYGAKQYECSLCYSDTFWKKHSITEKYPHCPNCGAKMMEG